MALKENNQLHDADGLAEMETARTVRRRKPVGRTRFNKVITAAIREFVQELDEDDVYRLCRGGSIWIDKDDARFGVVDQDSFEVLGSTSDSRVTEYGERIDACCLIDFGGLADGFVFDDGIDDYEDGMDAETEEMLYSEEKGRKALSDCVEASLGGDLDRVFCQELED
jgi:hypothetical protein